MLPSYILNQTEFYNRVAESFHEEIAKAHTEKEYKESLSRVCDRWRNELSDPNVMDYFLQIGAMEPEEISEIRRWYIDHAGPFQHAMLEAGLKPGERYTIFYLSDLGFPVTRKITFQAMWPCKYAQYTDAVKIRCREPRKRSDVVTTLYNQSVAIYAGWKDLQREDTHEKVSDENGVEVWRMKYGCFDHRLFEDGIKSLGQPLVIWRQYKLRESDGKIFA